MVWFGNAVSLAGFYVEALVSTWWPSSWKALETRLVEESESHRHVLEVYFVPLLPGGGKVRNVVPVHSSDTMLGHGWSPLRPCAQLYGSFLRLLLGYFVTAA